MTESVDTAVREQTFILDVTSNAFDGVDFAAMRVTLPEDRIERIKHLAAEVERLGVFKVVEFDYRPFPMKEDDDTGELVDDEDTRTEADQMCVTREHVFWTGYVKHTDTRWETSSIDVSALDHLLRAPTNPIDLREK